MAMPLLARGANVNIEDLYLELGRAMTEKVTVGQDAKAKEQDLQEKIGAWQQQVRGLQEDTKRKQERIQTHIDELQEAIRLASEGTDPCLAKLTAKERLEERRLVEKTAMDLTKATTFYGNVNVAAGGGVTGNTTWIPYQSYNYSVNQTPGTYLPTTK